MTNTKLPPIHPGEILLEEFLNPMEISPIELATEINLPLQTIKDIIQGKSNITANIALRLSRYFSWLLSCFEDMVKFSFFCHDTTTP